MKKQYIIPFFKNKEQHPFHIVDRSLLPIWTSQSVFMLILAILYYFHPNSITVMPNAWIFYSSSFFLFILSLLSWFIQVVIESGQGHHTRAVRRGLRLGMGLFIVSEVMFFFAFFWAFFHASLSPSIFVGGIWPPAGIQPLEIWGLPLVNTLLLLSSGVTITLAHRAILKANTLTEHYKFQAHLFATIIFGVTFLCCQWIEYKYGITFTWKENIYGSTFFVTTGFHGMHVVIGTLFLLFCLIRSFFTLMSTENKIKMYVHDQNKQLFMLRRLEKIIRKNLIQKNLTGWKQTIGHYIAHMVYFFIYLRRYYIIFPETEIHLKHSRDNVKRLKEKYQSDKTWLNWWIYHSLNIYYLMLVLVFHIQILVRKIYKDTQKMVDLRKVKIKLQEKFKHWPKYGFTKHQHLGFEAAAWYWHFVDVVWLFLFISIYWWGS